MYMETGDCNCGVNRLDIVQSLGWVYVHYIVFSHFYLFTYVQLQHGHVARNTKKESHMAYALYMKYSKYSKLAAGKFRHFFGGQLFFRWWMKSSTICRMCA